MPGQPSAPINPELLIDSATKSDGDSALLRSRLESSDFSVPMVSVVIPMRNESEHIAGCLDSLVNQTFPGNRYEVLVADGRSTDDSKKIVADYGRGHVAVRLLDNPAQVTPCGMNVGIRAARGSIIIIAGAHTTYPADFVENCVFWLHKTGADVVGGPVKTVINDEGFGAKVIKALLSSPFGVGDSGFRTSNQEGFVDSVPFGAFRREVFQKVGLYNERLLRNQDNDLSARIRAAGGTIYLTPALTTDYYPVKSFCSLLKYAFRTSKWHLFTLRENRKSMGLRHLIPAVFMIVLVVSLSLSFVNSAFPVVLLATLFTYFVTGFFFAFKEKARRGWQVALIQPFAAFCFHVAYGAGTLAGVKYLFRSPSSGFNRLPLSLQE